MISPTRSPLSTSTGTRASVRLRSKNRCLPSTDAPTINRLKPPRTGPVEDASMTSLVREEPKVAEKERRGPPSRFYQPELDGLRFVAFFLVFICHAQYGLTWQSWAGQLLLHVGAGGSFGVDLFFVLSAY